MARAALALLTLATLSTASPPAARAKGPSSSGPRLTARPAAPARPAEPGLTHLTLDPQRDALLFVPAHTAPGAKLPFILLLHGATMRPESQLRLFQEMAESKGIALLAVKSLDYTWDAIRGDYGPDLAFIYRALKEAFATVRVDPARVAVEGFSDGATYALGLALSNGDLFTSAMIFSAGFLPVMQKNGSPRLFISHGTADRILPIDRSGRPVVALLRAAKYRIEYREFAGPHAVPPDIAAAAVDWFLAGPGGK